jgi:hypothetical protein|tara:strand:- start:247 stop:633 length:387 start_codon:yes stop_codon:yes gene_type:complete
LGGVEAEGGTGMAGQEFFIRPASGMTSDDWIRLPDCHITVSISRRMTRTVTHGGEGDDLIDEGAESAEYVVEGEMDPETYRKVLEMFRSGQPYIHDPFEERDVKVVFSKLNYDGANEGFRFELIEDIR